MDARLLMPVGGLLLSQVTLCLCWSRDCQHQYIVVIACWRTSPECQTVPVFGYNTGGT